MHEIMSFELANSEAPFEKFSMHGGFELLFSPCAVLKKLAVSVEELRGVDFGGGVV